MEPTDVDAPHGIRPVVADQGEVRIVPASPDRADELIALALARSPRHARAEVAWPFESPGSFAELVLAAALDENDTLLGWGLVGRPVLAPADQALLRVTVARAHEGRGVGGALQAWLLRRLPSGTTRIRSGVFDDERRSLDVARHWGFESEGHTIDSRLELTDLPVPEPPAGVTLHDAPDLVFPDREDVERMLLATQADSAGSSGGVLDLDGLRALAGPDDIRIGVLARVRGRPAAITVGAVVGPELQLTYSGVMPAHRGRGLLRLVRQQAHRVGQAAGATVSLAYDEEEDSELRRVNAQLGYVVTGGVHQVVRHLPG